MEPLFKISQEYTFYEYKKFTKAVLKWNRIIVGAFLWFAFLSGVLLIGFNGISNEACFLVLFPVIYVILRKLSIKRYYNSNKILKDITEEYEFYEDYFVAKNVNSEAKIEYNMIHKVIETKTNFYIMVAQNQGYIISKEICSDELVEFLKELKAWLVWRPLSKVAEWLAITRYATTEPGGETEGHRRWRGDS